jgi:dihydroorotate dehydrogenase
MTGTKEHRRVRFDPFAGGTALLRLLPPNFAHQATLRMLRYGLTPRFTAPDDPVLAISLWDLDFSNPIGMSAGFDKNAEALAGLLNLGFGFAEAGTVTPEPQPGNPRPNLFRLTDDRALINRLGFPSQGVAAFARNLDRYRRSRAGGGIIGVNVGINTGTDDPEAEIARCIGELAGNASYITINVSCPNTPGLCDLQESGRLAALIARARDAMQTAGCDRKPPLLVKIAPDLSDDELADVARVAADEGVDGLIACNTTTMRSAGLRGPGVSEKGGLSGPVLMQRSTEVLAQLYSLTGGKMPLIGCGGVASGADAYAKIRAGASLVQIYTALVYHGPRLVSDIKADLALRLRADGFSRLKDAVGADHGR